MRVIAARSAVVLLVLGVFLARPAPVVDLNYRVCDLLTGWAGPGKPSGRVIIAEIDEKSLAQFGRWPWPRDLLGLLTRRILDQGASAVVLDMMFPQEDRGTPRPAADTAGAHGGTNDEILAGALSGRPAVVGYAFRFDSDDTASPSCPVPSLPLAVVGTNQSSARIFFHATGAVCSVPAISQAASGNGFLNAVPDSDGKMRRIPLIGECGGRYYPSLALAALQVYRPVSALQLATDAGGAWRLRRDDQNIPLEGPSYLRLRFRGGQRSFPYVPAAEILAGRTPDDRLRNKIVIVGGSALGMQNAVVAPADRLLPDVEIQATAIDNLLQGDSFRLPGDARMWELILALFGGLASTIVLTRLRFLWGALIVLGLAVGAWAVCTWALASTGMLFSPLPVTAVLACNLPVLTLLNYRREKTKADAAQRQLEATRELSQAALRESESRYHRLVENVNDAIIVSDLEGRLVFANRRFREWFGLEEGDISEAPAEQFVAPEWRVKLREWQDRRMRGEAAPDHCEYEGIRPDGTRIWIETLITRVEVDGVTVGTQAALRDITERKRIEAQYLQAQKMESVGRLAGGVAHDFNNLLTVINGYSDLLLSRMGPHDELRASLEQIRKAGAHAAELTQKLLAFSRKQLVQPRRLNLNLVVAEAREMVGRLIGEDIELITEVSPALGSVVADPGQMHQVLMNLVVNARDAMPHGGRIVVEAKNVEVDGSLAGQYPDLAPGSYVCLRVTDTGTGMSDDVKQHLFEPFFTTKEAGRGTGLGLSTIYGIVHQCGGWIGVTSEAGRGTTFHIYLPRIKPDFAEQPGAGTSAAQLRGAETVLVVEDQDAVRQLTSTILEGYGYRVLQASSGPEALALAERYPKPIHLLLSDIILPHMDGRVLAEKLRAARPEIKVLHISGYTEDMISYGRALASDLTFLPKPFTAEALVTKVRETLAPGETRRRTA